MKAAAVASQSSDPLIQPFPKAKDSNSWMGEMRGCITSARELALHLNVEAAPIEEVCRKFPVRIPRYYLDLIEKPFDPIWLQSVPDARELEDDGLPADSLNEEGDSPVPGLSHRYPDRALFLVSSVCAMYCRFCTRKRKVGRSNVVTDATIRAGLEYIREHSEIRDVIVSGGDPLLLSDERLDGILAAIRAIQHVEIIRVGTRAPCVLPSRVTPKLCRILRRHHPLYMNVHFNHPREVTPQAKQALEMLADSGIPLGSQTVLLKGVNDDPAVMKELVHKLLMARVKPYYIFQADMSHGTDYMRTRVEKGLEIISGLRGHTSGLGVPHYVIDSPGGGGKIPLLPDYLVSLDRDEVVLRNYKGCIHTYQQPLERDAVS